MIRWSKFMLVGMCGVVVQLAVLWTLVHLAGLPTLPATALAVEAALLHNFVWHEVWTWQEVTPPGRYRRLVRFHLASGLISIASNTLFTWAFREHLGLPLLISNLAAIGLTSVINFAAASRWVFRPDPRNDPEATRITLL
jgi:putative flippase GtrA